MNEHSDMELLDAYAGRRSEEAFRNLVARHVDFIYSAALRQLRDPHLAQEATQSAFIALAGKAGRLPRQTIVAGWLYRAVHFAGLNLQRGEARRKYWEEEAAIMHHQAGETGSGHDEDALRHVDAALAELNVADRDALILRFLRQLSLREVAHELGTSEEAAKKRVSRAVERLRGLLGQRGVVIPAATLATGLAELPLTAAPTSLPATLTALAAQAAPQLAPAGTGFALLTSVKAKVALTAGLIVAGALVVFLWRQWAQTSAPVATPPVAAVQPAATTMKIKLVSVMVDDQDKALRFYTEVLGFQKKRDFPTGAGRWLSLVSPEEPDGTELVLEPMGFAPSRVFQAALLKSGIPWTSFQVEDVAKQYDRLNRLGVVFSQKPRKAGPTTFATLEDTCGNLLQIFHLPGPKRAGPASAPKIKYSSVMVDDQEKALRFYTGVLGFAKKQDEPAGGGRWLTVVSSEDPDGTEVSLEPLGFASAQVYQKALREAGIAWTSFQVDNVPREHERLTKLGVKFTMNPTERGLTTVAEFDDTCGNLIQIFAPK